MRFMPTVRRDEDFDLFDDVFNAPFFGREALMKTDITEKDGKYQLEMDLPGYKKEDVKISLYNGNLTIEANHNESNEEKDTKGNVVRQERFTGSCTRTFYVGENAKESDVHGYYDVFAKMLEQMHTSGFVETKELQYVFFPKDIEEVAEIIHQKH